MKQRHIVRLGTMVLLVGVSMAAQAATVAEYPWAQVLQKIFNSLSGPVTFSLAGIAIILCAFSLAFGNLEGGMKRGVSAALGISVAVGAMSILYNFFGFSGAMIR